MTWMARKPHPQEQYPNCNIATGSKPHGDQHELTGLHSLQEWSEYKKPPLSQEELQRGKNAAVPAQQIVGEIMEEFGQTSNKAASAGVLEYYARGGAGKSGARTAYYEENVYSARRPAPDQMPETQGPGWIANLRPKWAEKDVEKDRAQTFVEALDKVKNVFVSRGAVNTGRSMWRVISKFDYDGSGAIDVFEFQEGMKEFGLELSKEEVYMIMDEFDKARAL